jgi:hypothetical protein
MRPPIRAVPRRTSSRQRPFLAVLTRMADEELISSSACP